MKTLGIILLVFFLSLFLVGCDHTVVESSRLVKYTIIDINPPKHFYVDLRDEETGRIFKHVHVSKHCNRWREVSLGQVVELPTAIMTWESKKERWIDIDAWSVCPGHT